MNETRQDYRTANFLPVHNPPGTLRSLVRCQSPKSPACHFHSPNSQQTTSLHRIVQGIRVQVVMDPASHQWTPSGVGFRTRPGLSHSRPPLGRLDFMRRFSTHPSIRRSPQERAGRFPLQQEREISDPPGFVVPTHTLGVKGVTGLVERGREAMTEEAEGRCRCAFWCLRVDGGGWLFELLGRVCIKEVSHVVDMGLMITCLGYI